MSDRCEFPSPREKARQSELHPCTPETVRSACIGAYRLRHVESINWGVRDWSRLQFEVSSEGFETRVLVRGASEQSALRFFLWEKLGSRSRLDVICREQ